MKASLQKMSKCVVVIVFTGVVLCVALVAGDGPRANNGTKPSRVYSRSIPNLPRDRGGGGGGRSGLGNPSEWTMSKANLVAEFFTSEPAPSRERIDRSQKSILSYLSGVLNNGSTEKATYLPAAAPPPPQRMAPPPPPPPYDNRDKSNANLIASGTSYNQHALPFEITRNSANVPPGGYSSPFRPIAHPQQSNFIFPSGISGSPASGYPQNVRPPRGPPIQPPRQFVWDSRPINGLRPPPVASNQQQQQQQNPRPSSQYLPPQLPLQSPRPPTPPLGPAVQIPKPPPQNLPQTQNQPQYSIPQAQVQSQYSTPPQTQTQSQYSVPASSQNYNNNSTFTPSTQYSGSEQKPDLNNNFPAKPQFQPASPPPKILDTYSKQAVYPPPPSGQYSSSEKPLIYVMANSSFDQSKSSNAEPSKLQFGASPLTPYTQYENEPVPPPPVPSSISLQKTLQQSPFQVDQVYQQPGQSASSSSAQQLNLNALALTEPLSHVLAEANAKAGEAMDKTIRFVIHKPEDEDVVKNAILEDAQNRYEDVKFVQGPTLKVQRKETVYLPPKKKTVVYILLKEPQIDTDVQVMSPQEDEPAPEVYITYQKSDGAVKTKHYSPKPIREEDMKKYLDIEEDSYGSGEESRFHPRFSKSTSVSLSTSSKVSRKTATTSTSMNKHNNATTNNDLLLANHKMPSSTNETTATAASLVTGLKTSPLLYTSRNANPQQIQISNSTASVRSPQKKPRSSEIESVVPLPRRRILRHNPIQCPTGT